MESILKRTELIAIMTAYFFLCGSIYSFFFWSYLDINIGDLINVSDLPKSVFTSLFISSVIIGMALTVQSLNEYFEKKTKRKFGSFLFVVSAFLSIALLVLYFIDIKWFEVISFLIGFRTIVIVNEQRDYFLNYKPFIFLTALSVAFICGIIGYASADVITKNINGTKYVKEVISADTLLMNQCRNKKLLGYIGDKIILSNKENSEHLIVSQSSLNAITFTNDLSRIK